MSRPPRDSLMAFLDEKFGALERRFDRLEGRRLERQRLESGRVVVLQDEPAPKPPMVNPAFCCPVCRLEKTSRRKEQACLWCGFVFSATLALLKEK